MGNNVCFNECRLIEVDSNVRHHSLQITFCAVTQARMGWRN